MSSVNEVSWESGCCTRATGFTTKVPEPWRRIKSPSRTRSSTALRTVTRLTLAYSARSRSAGSAAPWPSRPELIASSSVCRSFR